MFLIKILNELESNLGIFDCQNQYFDCHYFSRNSTRCHFKGFKYFSKRSFTPDRVKFELLGQLQSKGKHGTKFFLSITVPTVSRSYSIVQDIGLLILEFHKF